MKKEKISFHGAGRLREERERIGFNQGDSETLFGVSRVTWGKYERGESTPGADVLSAMAEMGGDILYIVTGRRTPLGVAQPRAAYTPAERAAEAIRAMKLSEADASMVTEIAKRLSE
jgi:transcriptional regulator with XRE-family HTH domain